MLRFINLPVCACLVAYGNVTDQVQRTKSFIFVHFHTFLLPDSTAPFFSLLLSGGGAKYDCHVRINISMMTSPACPVTIATPADRVMLLSSPLAFNAPLIPYQSLLLPPPTATNEIVPPPKASIRTVGNRAARGRWLLPPLLCRRAQGRAGRWSSRAAGFRSRWGARPAAPRMTGSAARELSRPRGCLSFAAVAAVRDTLTPTHGPAHPGPAGRTIMRLRLHLSRVLYSSV